MRTVPLPQLTGLAPCDLSDSLERGEIVQFPQCPIALPSDADLAFLRGYGGAMLRKKNVSYYPDAKRLTGAKGDPQPLLRMTEILAAHAARVRRFLEATMPELTRGWRVGTSSFRPLEEKGRDLSPHASNERVHVDAGAYGATHGDRILRFFINIHLSASRVWATRGSFGELLERHGAAAGLHAGAVTLDEGPIDRARTGGLSALSKLGIRMVNVLDSSPYDRAMRRFHNFMKDDPRFLEGKDGYQELSFPPGSAWMVLTDTRSHACLSGQFALVDTFIVPLANCRVRETAPFYLLSRS